MSVLVSTDRLVPATKARRQLGKLLVDVNKKGGSYFAIMDNGVVKAYLVSPQLIAQAGVQCLEHGNELEVSCDELFGDPDIVSSANKLSKYLDSHPL